MPEQHVFTKRRRQAEIRYIVEGKPMTYLKRVAMEEREAKKREDDIKPRMFRPSPIV